MPMRPTVTAAIAPGGELADDRGQEAFRTARRHSRRVRVLRWALPAAALGGAALIVFVVWFDPLRLYRDLPVEFGRITITDNKLTIEAPKLTGFTQDRRPYWVTAVEAAQDLGAPERIELTGITGQAELANRGETRMRAERGVYDMKAGTLLLSSGIEIGATGGYKVELTDALMQVRAGRIVTDRPVRATFPDGTLAASRLEILEHGERVRFGGGVTVTLHLPADAGAAETDPPEARP